MQSVIIKFRNFYTSSAIIILNTAVFGIFLLFFITVLYFFNVQKITIQKKSGTTVTESGYFYSDGTAVDNGKRSPSNLLIFDFKAYEGVMSELEISQMLDEIYEHSQLGFAYEPYVEYSPRIFEGQYLNVDRDSTGTVVRRTVNPGIAGKDDPIEIFAFGGSTTFGFGVPDQHTWPTYLSQILNARAQAEGLQARIKVTNFGRVGFYPTQELHLLMDILRGGKRPDQVVFLDGVNFGRSDDTPLFTPGYRRIIDEAQLGPVRMSTLESTLKSARLLLKRTISADSQQRLLPEEGYDVNQLIERFLQFRRGVVAISELYGTRPLFFLQPDGQYNYPDHLRSAGVIPTRPAARALKVAFHESFPQDSGFVDLTGLFAAWGDRKALLDSAHYTPNFSRFLAEQIASHIDLQELKRHQQPDGLPTGHPR